MNERSQRERRNGRKERREISHIHRPGARRAQPEHTTPQPTSSHHYPRLTHITKPNLHYYHLARTERTTLRPPPVYSEFLMEHKTNSALWVVVVSASFLWSFFSLLSLCSRSLYLGDGVGVCRLCHLHIRPKSAGMAGLGLFLVFFLFTPADCSYTPFLLVHSKAVARYTKPEVGDLSSLVALLYFDSLLIWRCTCYKMS